MASELDPFTIVHRALWDLVEADEGFTELVAVGNRIKFTGLDRSPKKDKIAEADLPEVMLVSESWGGNLHATSSHSLLTRQYTFIISTGDYRICEKLYPVEFAILRALANWKTTLSALTWRGQTFVKTANLVSGTTGDSDPSRNRGISGWSTLWRCQVDMYLPTSQLKTPPA